MLVFESGSSIGQRLAATASLLELGDNFLEQIAITVATAHQFTAFQSLSGWRYLIDDRVYIILI